MVVSTLLHNVVYSNFFLSSITLNEEMLEMLWNEIFVFIPKDISDISLMFL